MSNKVDKLFKEKLGAHSLPPSAQAWEKIEANLSKKNKAIVWFRVAAVIALAGAFTFGWVQWNGDTEVNESLVKKTDSVTTQQKVIQPQLAHKEPKTNLSEQKKSARQKKSNPSTKKEKTQEFVPEIKKEENPLALITEEKVKEIVQPQEVTTAPAVAAKKSMKITFNLPALQSQPEVKTETEVMVADAPEEKKTTLQKAADVAHDIRSGDVLGSLREAKNDLFALEFKKDKSKKN